MEDIEDMVGGLGDAPLGLHLPKASSPPAGRRNGSNGVVIKPRRRISVHAGGSNVSTGMDSGGETTSVVEKVPGTQVRVTILCDY